MHDAVDQIVNNSVIAGGKGGGVNTPNAFAFAKSGTAITTP